MEPKIIKLFISQPMKDKTPEEIKSERERAIEEVQKQYSDYEIKVIDSYIEGAPENAPALWYLGVAIQLLADANVAYFIKGWNKYRGCKIENLCAREYNIENIIEEQSEEIEDEKEEEE